MASNEDVEMADAARPAAPPSVHDVLNYITTGQIDALASFAPTPSSLASPEAPQSGADADVDHDLLAPFLPLLTRVHEVRRHSCSSLSSPSALSSVLARYDHVNELIGYASAVQTLTLADLEGFAAEPTDTAVPVYRQFEGADPRKRACIVLHLVVAFTSGSISTAALHENELVRNDIYKPHLVAILVCALATDALISTSSSDKSISLAKVITFCLAVPLGAELIEAIVLNDPSTVGHIVDVVVESIHSCNPLESLTADAAAALTSASLLPFELRQAQAACSALAAVSPAYASQILYKLRDDVTSVAATFVAFQLLVGLPTVARGEDHFYAAFVYQWLRRSAREKSPPALHVFLQAALSREGEMPSEQDKADTHPGAATFLEEARFVMSQFRQFLMEDLVQFRITPVSGEDAKTPSRFSFTAMLQVLIGALVIGRLHPEDYETTQLLKLFDRITKEIPQLKQSTKSVERMVSLMYVLVLLLCSPSAPAFAKMPSQREDSTKLVLQLAQQCIYSLYNTKAACPLLILSSVLLYTKSPSLLPCLNSFLGETFPLTTVNIRVEHLHGVGDAILKPIMTESVMAREVLTVFQPAEKVSARDHDAMDEMVLRSFHGLLTEKSFLRHHHARKLEEWIASLLDRVTTPFHPLLVGVLFEWIENYVMAFEYPIAQRPLLQLAVIPLSQAFVKRVLNETALTVPFAQASQGLWARASLALVYALQFNQRIRLGSARPGTKLAAFATNQGGGLDANDPNSSLRGSAEILLAYDLDTFPLHNIWRYVSQYSGVGGLFEFVAPTLGRLLAEEYPQLTVDDGVPDHCTLVRSAPRSSKLLFVSGEHDSSGPGDYPVVSWASACLWLRQLPSAPPAEREETVRLCVSALFPLAILSAGRNSSDVGPESFLALFSELYPATIRRTSPDPARLDRRITEGLCVPQLVWRHCQQSESRQTVRKSLATSPTWIHHDQLIEQPFYILQNAYAGVLSSPPLLRMVLGLVTRFRDECIFQLRRRESMAVLAKKAAQANDAAANGQAAASSPAVVSDVATQQFLTVQDCILVQSMLALVAKLNAKHEKDECAFLLYDAINSLLVETKPAASAAVASTASPPLALVIHTQGYDASLVASFVNHAPSLQKLWAHWMHQTSADSVSNTSKSSSDRRGGGGSGSTPSHSGVKAIADFMNDPSIEKDLIKWQFRVRVFFTLCGKYFTTPAHSAATMQTIKQILNRLRGIAVSSSGSSKGVLHAMSIGDNSARVAFVDAVLNDAIDGCAPHAELRSEMAQFLLNFKKHVGSSATSSSSPALRVTSPTGIDVIGAPLNHHQELERVVFRAYQKILQLVQPVI